MTTVVAASAGEALVSGNGGHGRTRYGELPLYRVLATQERSVRWLARKTGVSSGYITEIAKGTFQPSAAFKTRAAAVLGFPETLLFPTATDTASTTNVALSGSHSVTGDAA
jgi:hypothetical protein